MNRILDEQFFQAIEEMGRLQKVILDLKGDARKISNQQRMILFEGPLEQLRQLELQVEALAFADQADFWLIASGEAIDWGDSSIGCMTSLLQSLRAGFKDFVSKTRTGLMPGVSAAQAKGLADLRIAAFQPGSMRIGFRLAEQLRPQFNDSRDPDYSITVAAFLKTARGLSQMKSPEWFSQFLPTEQIWEAQLSLLPILSVMREYNLDAISFADPQSVESLISFPKNNIEPIQNVLSEHRYHVAALTAAMQTPVIEPIHELTGRVREIDLDQQRMILYEPLKPNGITCEFDADLLEEIKRALDKDVTLTAVKCGRRRFKVVSLNIRG